MESFLLRIVSRFRLVWSLLPKELKVGIYVAVSTAMATLATQLLGLGAIDLVTVARVLVANILLAFVTELRPRIERIKANKG